jgi:short-subunit dehydrogenase
MIRNLPNQSNRSSRIIFVSSGVGMITVPRIGAYCATKHALESMNDALRMELKSWNIDVICIEPGRIETNFANHLDMTSKSNEMKNSSVEESVLLRYAKFAAQINSEDRYQKKISSKVDLVSNKIFRALYDSRPLHRYTCGIDALFLINIVNIIPGELFDLILGRIMMRP